MHGWGGGLACMAGVGGCVAGGCARLRVCMVGSPYMAEGVHGWGACMTRGVHG